MSDNKHHGSRQEYMEVIYRLSKSRKKTDDNFSSDSLNSSDDDLWISNSEIASMLNIKPPSVTEMLGKLMRDGLIEWEKRKGVRLTRKGYDLGKKVLDMHLLLEDFFTLILEIEDENVKHRLACLLEHDLMDEPTLASALKKSIEKFKKQN
ncbi:MAG: metal-dependent transcriptional regulator [Promethearchaeota archaeon]